MHQGIFSPVTVASFPDFEPFRLSNHFSDTTFSMLLAWSVSFQYAYYTEKDWLMLRSTDRQNVTRFSFLRSQKTTAPERALQLITEYCQIRQIPAILQYVPEEDLPMILRAADSLQYSAKVFAVKSEEDYIYKKSEYCCISGNRNKSKRGSQRVLQKTYPDLHYVEFQPGMEEIAVHIFEDWCGQYQCKNCVYGCEKQALINLLQAENRSNWRMGFAFDGNAPLSFALFEQINQYTEACYFQKNRKKIRGLMYWLSCKMAQQTQEIPFLNLGEDMGLEGLRMDKTSLHPCSMLPKYSILLQRR